MWNFWTLINYKKDKKATEFCEINTLIQYIKILCSTSINANIVNTNV